MLIDGTFHLFFQYNPTGSVWGDICWGHASSRDLLAWTEHAVAIPEGTGEAIYSGSTVIDTSNSSGLGTEADPPLVALYTSAYERGEQAQSLAFSADSGATWRKNGSNPVLSRRSTAFRDPKVFWHAQPSGEGSWVMVAVEAEAREVHIFGSPDLVAWTPLSVFAAPDEQPGLWECPDLFRLPVEGEPGEAKWVLVISRDPGRVGAGTFCEYFVGDFTGERFIPDSSAPQRMDAGPDFYAATSFSGVADDRRIVIAWMSNWNYAEVVPTRPWRGSMTLPREVRLVRVDGALVLAQSPAREFDSAIARANTRRVPPFLLEGNRPFVASTAFELCVVMEPLGAQELSVSVVRDDASEVRVHYDVGQALLTVDRRASGQVDFHASFASSSGVKIGLCDGVLRLRILVDACSVEVFAQDGRAVITSQVFPTGGLPMVRISSSGGASRVSDLRLSDFVGGGTGG